MQFPFYKPAPEDRLLALSLLQPCASLMDFGAKNIETRSWHTDYRGDVAIAASKRWVRDDLELALEAPSMLRAWSANGITQLKQLPLGSVLCVRRLLACMPTEEIVHLAEAAGSSPLTICGQEISDDEFAFGNYAPYSLSRSGKKQRRYGWIFGPSRRLVAPLPVKGTLGLFKLPDDLVRTIDEQIAA